MDLSRVTRYDSEASKVSSREGGVDLSSYLQPGVDSILVSSREGGVDLSRL